MSALPCCWGSPPMSGVHWRRWRPAAPALVAEAFRPVGDPLAHWLQPGPPAAPEGVAAALARALLPPESAERPPGWLRPDQGLSFRRAAAAGRRYGGVLVADGVGTGKTFVGLAVAAALLPGYPVHVVAPAVLQPQWRKAATQAGVECRCHSHETLSRGRAPSPGRGAVVIDESHRFRNPRTRRYLTLAPWCAGRPGILLSATPLVNRLDDLAHQLLLLVRDDALAWSGIRSLRSLEPDRPPGALAHLVITGEDRSTSLPAREERRLIHPETAALREMVEALGSLSLSREPATSCLIRTVMYRALASSPAALAVVLTRYRALLHHAEDAAASGRSLSRHDIRRFVGADGEQLVFWPLVAEPAPGAELAVADLPLVIELARRAREWAEQPDPKAGLLHGELQDGKVTLVFTTATATVAHLRTRLGRRGIAWCTGASSGIDGAVVPRDAVLDWFQLSRVAGEHAPGRPRTLIATDVAAEGLDLPLVERVVHYDLPWTAVRLEQRSGRAIRLGSTHHRVEIVRILPGPLLGSLLNQESILDTKAGLPAQLGLESDRQSPWRLRSRLAVRWNGRAEERGVAMVRGARPGVVAGFRVLLSDGTDCPVVVGRREGRWSDRLDVIGDLLESAAGTHDRSPPLRRDEFQRIRRKLASLAREALRWLNGIPLAERSPPRGGLRRRLIGLAAALARDRRSADLRRVERGLRYLGRGHTAGEALELESWAGSGEAALLERLSRLGAEAPPPHPVDVSLIGILVVTGPPG